MLEQPVRARLDRDGDQVVDVTVRAGYHPDAIVARPGLPLRLVFRRDDDDVCSERIVFSGPRLDRRLAPSGTTTIDLPAQGPGEVRFTCGMGRYRGHIVFVDEPSSSSLARLREHAGRLDTHLRMALVLWICSLPLIALVSVVSFDAGAGIAAAAAALVALVVGCLWAFRGSAHGT